MKATRWKNLFAAARNVTLAFSLMLVTDGLSCLAMAQDRIILSEEQATEIGTEVYLFGYPLITLEMTRRVMTNTATPVGMRAPMGQFTHVRKYPPITYRDVPGANADTLYSAA